MDVLLLLDYTVEHRIFSLLLNLNGVEGGRKENKIRKESTTEANFIKDSGL